MIYLKLKHKLLFFFLVYIYIRIFSVALTKAIHECVHKMNLLQAARSVRDYSSKMQPNIHEEYMYTRNDNVVICKSPIETNRPDCDFP